MKTHWLSLGTILAILTVASTVTAQEPFSELVGPVSVKPVSSSLPLSVPYITWGGDVATFRANGGLTTKQGSIFDELGLDLELTNGDDFIAQVKDYMSGKTPFLRGTFRMLGQASEVLGSDPRTKPVVILQLSWSQGDHIVAREGVKSLNEIQGKRIACQQGGPHVGLLYDTLALKGLKKDDIEIVWVDDLTGANGPAEAFRKDKSIDACCVITPDLLGLTGGFDTIGTGAEGTVKGAHTINSTQQMSRSIADVYAVRSDWYEKNRTLVEKFAAGYLKGTEEIKQMRDQFEDSHKMSSDYRGVLQMSQDIFGKDVLPTLEIDAHGLLLDCEFARLPGQIAFFKGYLDDGRRLKDPEGFDKKMTTALDLATNWGYAKTRNGFDPPSFDYKKIASLAGLKPVEPKMENRIVAKTDGPEGVGEFPGMVTGDDDVIFSFEITFPPNESEFSTDRYGAEFSRAIESAGAFRNAVIVIRGHSDPTKTLVELLRAGMSKKILKRVGKTWYLNGKPLKLEDTPQVVELIDSGSFSGVREHDPLATMQAALTLSQARAETVKDKIVALAKERGVALDASQLKPQGVGISDPVVKVPTNAEETAPNRRVEFRIVRIQPEDIQSEDFDLLGGDN